MTAEVDIYNMALSKIGVSFQVQTPGERSKQGNACRQFYPQARDLVLRDFPWPFAKKVRLLALVDDEFPGWTYVYDYPDECLAMRQIVDTHGARMLGRSWYYDPSTMNGFIMPKIPFQIASNADMDRKIILTDMADAYGVYTGRVTDPNVFDFGFIDTVSWKLAFDIGPIMQAEAAYIGAALQHYTNFKQWAQAAALNEGQQDPEAESPSISIR